MPESIPVKVPYKAYQRLKKISKVRDVPMSELLAQYISRLEVNKVKTESDVAKCGECGEEIPVDSIFCPYCGVEFTKVEVDEDEDEDEEEEDPEEDSEEEEEEDD